MNYFLSESCNIPETHELLFSMLKDLSQTLKLQNKCLIVMDGLLTIIQIYGEFLIH